MMPEKRMHLRSHIPKATGFLVLFAFLSACVRSSEIPETDYRIEVLGNRALIERADRITYVFAPDKAPRLWTEPGVSIDTVTLTTTVGLSNVWRVHRQEARGDGVLWWLEGAPVAHGTKGVLQAAGAEWSAEWSLPGDVWPRVARALIRKTPRSGLETIATGSGPVFERLGAYKVLARLEAGAGNIEAHQTWQQARAQLALESGVISDAAEARLAAAYHAYRRRNFAEVAALLARVEAMPSAVKAQASIRSGLIRGYMARELGRYREALGHLETAKQAAWRVDAPEHAWLEKALVQVHLELGQYPSALRALEALAPQFMVDNPRVKLPYLIDRGWAEGRAMAQGVIAADWNRLAASFRDALTLAKAIPDRDAEVNVTANLLWTSYMTKNAEARQQWSQALRALGDHGFATLFADLVEARVALDAEDPAAAERRFSAVLERSQIESAGDVSDYTWRARYGRALAQWARGKTTAAATDFEVAMQELERLSERAELRAHRAPFLDDRKSLFADALRFYLTVGRPVDAFSVAERARAQVLRALELEVRTRRLAPEDLARLTVLQIAYFHARDALEPRARMRRTVPTAEREAFDAETARLRAEVAARFAEVYAHLDGAAPSPARSVDWPTLKSQLASATLVAFASVATRTVVFVASANGLRVTWQDEEAVQWSEIARPERHVYIVPGGDMTAERIMQTVMPKILPRTTASLLPAASFLTAPLAKAEGKNLVVADPMSDLPYARREGQRVAGRIDAHLLTGVEATKDRVLKGLGQAGSFHFAGHGVLTPADPWKARLELAKGTSLGLEDLLVGPPKVRHVVLSGCETGKTGQLSASFSIGLAEGFLLAGTQTLLATLRKVDDRDAARFMDRFYAHGGAVLPVVAYRAAAQDFMKARDDAWRAFVLMGKRQ